MYTSAVSATTVYDSVCRVRFLPLFKDVKTSMNEDRIQHVFMCLMNVDVCDVLHLIYMTLFIFICSLIYRN